MAESNPAGISYFQEQLDSARTVESVLRFSWERAAKRITLLPRELKPEQLEILEALAARFSRMADMSVQKLFRAVDAFELVDEGSMIDRLNRMEKRGVITKTEEWVEIRQIRNQIAHDYVLNDLISLYHSVYRQCPLLFQTMAYLEKYGKAWGWVN